MEKNLGYEILNAGTGKETSFNQVVAILNEKLGKSIEPIHVENPIENYVPRTCADLTKMKKLLEYEPQVELRKGIESIMN